MADTKRGRDKQARNAEKRQRARELEEARDRGDEQEPPRVEGDLEGDDVDAPNVCHRRGCDEPATFVVLERYQEETGQGSVEAEALLCRTHTAEESPANLDATDPDYVFRVEPLVEMDFAGGG